MLRCDNNGIGGYDGVKNVIVEGGLWNGNTDHWPNTADFQISDLHIAEIFF